MLGMHKKTTEEKKNALLTSLCVALTPPELIHTQNHNKKTLKVYVLSLSLSFKAARAVKSV